MSLVSLTFGEGKSEFSVKAPIQVLTPEDQIQIKPGIENKAQIKKACQFLGHTDVYLVAQIVSGVVANTMKGDINGRGFEIVELESKYGHRIAKQGMTIGLTVRGISKDAFTEGCQISFNQ
jgi:hypothetical protein